MIAKCRKPKTVGSRDYVIKRLKEGATIAAIVAETGFAKDTVRAIGLKAGLRSEASKKIRASYAEASRGMVDNHSTIQRQFAKLCDIADQHDGEIEKGNLVAVCTVLQLTAQQVLELWAIKWKPIYLAILKAFAVVDKRLAGDAFRAGPIRRLSHVSLQAIEANDAGDEVSNEIYSQVCPAILAAEPRVKVGGIDERVEFELQRIDTYQTGSVGMMVCSGYHARRNR